MKLNLLKFLLAGVLLLLFSTKKSDAATVTFTALPGNAAQYLAKGAVNQVVLGFQVTVGNSGMFTPGPLDIATSTNLNGFVTGNLYKTTTANPALATLGTPYAASINSGLISISSFPNLNPNSTSYFYLVLNITTTTNPWPANVVFSLPPAGASSITQNSYNGSYSNIIVTNSVAAEPTYYFLPSVTYATPQVYTQGTAISTLSPTSVGATTYSATLPAGLTINSSTGAITGTPTVVSAATNYTVTAANPAGSSTAVINITVNPAFPAISYASPQTYIQNTAISALSPSSTGGTVASYSATLPAGLSIDPATGIITGTPTTVSTAANYTVTATNVTGSSTTNINITVKPALPAISYITPQIYNQYDAITSLSPTSTGGAVTTYTATLPGGLTINAATGAITGTPITTSAATNYTVTATNATGSSTAIINITVKMQLPIITYPTPPTYTYNTAIATLSPTSTGGAVASYSATLPAGLSINATTGAITGTPTMPGSATIYTVTATNSGGSSTATITFTVNPAAPTATAVTQCGAGAPLTASDLPSGGTYNWYNVASGGVAVQSSTSATLAVQSTNTYYVSYTLNGVESARTAVTATINPIVTAPYSGAYLSYPFNGNTNDISGYGNTGTNSSGASLTTDRYGSANAAYSFNGSSNYISNTIIDNDPATYTVSIWFKTTSTTGGTLIGLESGNNADRVIYMSNNGQIYFGLNVAGTIASINSAASYNNGSWHHVIVTSSSSGSTLYIDGIAQATNLAMNAGNGTNGDWQIGFVNLSGWTSAPSNNYFTGSLDDIAVYHRVLTSAEISTSNDLNQIGVGTASTCSALAFTAPTITGATYTWKDPNNITLTGQSVSFPGAVAGNYTLTVTGGTGGCSSSVTLIPVVYSTSTSAFNVPASIPLNTNTTVALYSAVAGSTYTWNFGVGASPATSTGTGPFSVQWSSAGVKTITLTITTSGGCVTTSTKTITVTSAAYGNYTYSRTITLNNKAVGITTNLTNFPVLVSIQNNDLIVSGSCSDKIQNPTSNYDFAFFDPSAPSELNYQVENYNPTTGTLLVWVKVPTLYAATNNTLTFYYGAKTPSVTHDAAFSANTWNADYQAVYHFNESGYTGTTADGTAYNRTASLAGFQSSDYVANGKIGSCYTFGGTGGTSSVNDMEAPQAPATTAFTLSAWVKMTANSTDEKILSDEGPAGLTSGGYKLGIYTENIPETEDNGNINRPEAYYYNNPAPTPNAPVLSVGTWYYVQGVYNGSSISTYVNGVQYAVLPSTGNCTLATTLFIGIGEAKEYPFVGLIDEPRVSNVAKSSDWLLMEYTNQNNPTAFIVSTSAASVTLANGAGIPGEISYTWNGGSTNPALGSNWTNTVTGTTGTAPPFDGSVSIVIPGGLANYFVLPADAALYGLTMGNGAIFNLGGHILSVGCHIYNGSGGQILYGSSSTAGGITFNGSLANQYYYGTTTSGIANVANLTVNNSAGGTITITGGAFGVNNTLTLTNGNLIVDNTGSGSLTLLSGATNSATVAAIPAGFAITGNVNVQRYLTNGSGTRGYRLLSSPVNANSSTSGSGNSINLTYLNANVPFNSVNYYGAYTQGPGTGFTLNGSVHPIIYLYDETQATNNRSFTGGKNIGVYTITGAAGSPAYGVITQGATVATSAVTLPVATSYLLYFVGSDQSSVVSTSRVPDATTLTATGYLNQGNVPFVFWKSASTSLPYTVTAGTSNYGLFQVGNPYASTISLNTLYTDNYIAGSNAIGSAFYELIPAGNYVSYNAANGHVSDLRASQYIVSGQGFLAQTTANGQTLTFKEDQKTAYNAAATLLESISGPSTDAHIINKMPSTDKHTKGSRLMAPVNTNSVDAGLHVQLKMDSLNYAQTGIYYSNTASDKYLSSEDAIEVDGGTPQVFLSSYSSDSVKLSINTVADYGQGKRVRLYANANVTGTYTMSLADISGIDTTGYSVYLVDNKLADSLDLVHFKTYAFTLNTADSTTFGSDRFVLAIEHKAVQPYKLSTFSGEKVPAGVQLNWTAINAGNYTGYTLQKLNAENTYDSLYSVQSDTSVTAYKYTDTHPVIGNNTYRLAQNGLTGAITYSVPVTIGYNSSSPNGALTLYPNPAKTIINVNLVATTINSPTYVADIYNASGAVVNHQTVTSASWTNDVSAYKLGLYVLQVKDTAGNIVGVAKFIKVE